MKKAFAAATLRRGAMHAAPALLGALLVREDGRVARIIETEAYTQDDPASHSHRGRTARNAAMFARAGTCYVYRSHGLHWCMNIVTGAEGTGEAVLVRAVEPVVGLAAMVAARGWEGRRLRDLANGPGKLCVALGITSEHDGLDLLDPASAIFLSRGEPVAPAHVLVTPRIGITKAADWPRRFVAAASR